MKKERKGKPTIRNEMPKDDMEEEKTPYFWKPALHQEFMRHFQVYGKTWKVVSSKMAENGIRNKDQLQCRTHGQKYLLSLSEIQRNIADSTGQMDKKIYQKMQRYEDDKRFLYQNLLEDLQPKNKKPFLNLDFQSAEAGH